eukprot:3940692-Rhodomonas_salina.4
MVGTSAQLLLPADYYWRSKQKAALLCALTKLCLSRLKYQIMEMHHCQLGAEKAGIRALGTVLVQAEGLSLCSPSDLDEQALHAEYALNYGFP